MKIIIALILIILHFTESFAITCEEEVKVKLDNQEAQKFAIAVYIEDRDLSIATFTLWEITQKDIDLTIDYKCNNKSLSSCHKLINAKIYEYEKHGIQLSYEDKTDLRWRCEN